MAPQCFKHHFIRCCSLVSNSASAAGVSATFRWNLLGLVFPTSTVRESHSLCSSWCFLLSFCTQALLLAGVWRIRNKTRLNGLQFLTKTNIFNLQQIPHYFQQPSPKPGMLLICTIRRHTITSCFQTSSTQTHPSLTQTCLRCPAFDETFKTKQSQRGHSWYKAQSLQHLYKRKQSK